MQYVLLAIISVMSEYSSKKSICYLAKYILSTIHMTRQYSRSAGSVGGTSPVSLASSFYSHPATPPPHQSAAHCRYVATVVLPVRVQLSVISLTKLVQSFWYLLWYLVISWPLVMVFPLRIVATRVANFQR